MCQWCTCDYSILLTSRLLQEDTLSSFSGDASDELQLSMYRMDIDRTMFLLRAYLRIRILKVIKHYMQFNSDFL